VGSLLEVGTGFHPELTGRENVFLNGAILGMSRGEIRKQFDAIVDFAEVERFLETPVKRYSSGMYVRLAFAVAAHLNPEILVIDEVLAVGDAEFQRKCLGKMGEVAKGGRTVLFVSHNMQAMRLLCSTAKLLDEGTLVFDGTVEQCTRLYGDIRQHCGQQICTNAIVMDPAIAVTSVEVNGSASSWQTLPGDCRVLTLAVSGTAAHACRADIEVRFHDQYRTPLGFFSPGYDRGAGETIGPGKFTLVRAASLPRLNRCTLVLDIDIVWPGVCYFVRMRSALTLTAEGAPTTTGKVFDSDKGAGWVFLQDVAGTRISDQDEGTGDRGSEQ
jgi:lipopolysaccharide transport system ATP-binding protein